MNSQLIQQGRAAYRAGDFSAAAQMLGAAKTPNEIMGEADHLRGNALMHLGMYAEAAEAYAAGELKHGTISLIEPGTLVVALGTYEPLFDKAMSNVVEVKARGAEVLALATEPFKEKMAHTADSVIAVPETHPVVQPSLGVVPLQLFAYYVALQRGCDIDKPRNLAKSVTVE